MNIEGLKPKSFKDFIGLIIGIVVIVFLIWFIITVIWESNTSSYDYPEDYEQCVGPACW
ncbi:hypothetical protein KKE19_02505 [Patescibacteria group bacterium]|nr:hypothetical protein [Patescibacteria group bacterium]MBU4367707.1 hypothetical protein [Patescibacteria group bacterium]MBU4461843.1 hypothetical protein [Patescibacteria group bacterium]MCG2700026.1 hypothetical protein [Candidatus Parcubacteria bacterium]